MESSIGLSHIAIYISIFTGGSAFSHYSISKTVITLVTLHRRVLIADRLVVPVYVFQWKSAK